MLVGTAPASIETGRLGRFDIEVDRGTHRVSVVVPGFAATTIERVVVHGGSRLDVELHPLDAKQLRTISRITVDGRLALPSGTIPSVLFSRKSLEEAGFNHITDALEQLPSATIARPNGGAPNAVAVVALRGPDPSETLVALDGQILNNTNTGDLDLSQFPISPLRAIEVTERLGPESASAANTIGGEVNLQSLAPTRDSHAMASFSYGSFNAATLAANATGSAGHRGYAFALGNATTQGFARDDAANFDNADRTPLSELEAGLPGSVDTNCVAANGNPHERPEHVTAYELGFARQVDPATTVDVSAYRANLRDPIELAYPLGTQCPRGVTGSDVAGQVIPINISNAVYEGGALRVRHRIGTPFARLAYGINVAYPRALPLTVANPTSGANLVEHKQFAGIPIHVATLSLQYHQIGYHGDIAATYRGINNGRNAGPYVTVSGALGKTIGGPDYTFAFTNLTNAVAGSFTRLGAGIPYATPVDHSRLICICSNRWRSTSLSQHDDNVVRQGASPIAARRVATRACDTRRRRVRCQWHTSSETGVPRLSVAESHSCVGAAGKQNLGA